MQTKKLLKHFSPIFRLQFQEFPELTLRDDERTLEIIIADTDGVPYNALFHRRGILSVDQLVIAMLYELYIFIFITVPAHFDIRTIFLGIITGHERKTHQPFIYLQVEHIIIPIVSAEIEALRTPI